MTQVFLSYLLTSLVGTVAALVLFLIRPFTKKWFSASWHYYVWAVVLLVMLVPLKADVQKVFPKENEALIAAEQVEEDIRLEKDVHTEGEVITFDRVNEKLFFENIGLLAIIWLLGMMIIFTGKVAGYYLFMKMVLKKSYKVQLDAVLKNVNVRVMKDAKSPFVVGCINPVLVLPDKEMATAQKENILAHEMMHIKRCDVFYKWIVAVCKSMHWFNPFMYLIAKEIEKECEISCDEAVVRNMSNVEKKTYADTIMAFVSEYGRANAFTTGMATSKETLKKRLLAVKHGKRKSKINIGISVFVLLALILSFTFVSAFAGGMLLPLSENENPTLYFDEEHSLYGYKDNEGNVIIEPSYLKAGDFYENAALVILPENPKVLRVIKPDGEYLFDKEFSAVNNFNSGYALIVANDEGKYTYINKKGEVATWMLFDAAENFDDGFARVVLNGQSGVVDTLFNFYPDEEDVER